MNSISLIGTAYSPYNPSWIYGPLNVSFDLSGGTLNGSVIDGATVTNFQLAFSGEHIDLPAATANYYANAPQSGLAVFGPPSNTNTSDFVFVYNANATGGFRDTEQAVYVDFYKESFGTVATPEPSAVALLIPGLLLVWFRVWSSRRRSSVPWQ